MGRGRYQSIDAVLTPSPSHRTPKTLLQDASQEHLNFCRMREQMVKVRTAILFYRWRGL